MADLTVLIGSTPVAIRLGENTDLALRTVAGAIEAINEDLASIVVADFRARALSSAANPAITLDWQVKGAFPTAQTLAWDGYSLTLDGAARSFTTRDQSVTTGLGVVGNSLSDSTDVTTRWSQGLATALGVDLVSVARYSSDARQKYRLGAAPITLTITGNTVPATGSPGAAITHINGVAPSNNPDPFELGGNPASFLNTGDAGLTTGVSMDGYIGDAPVRVSIPNAASTAYTIIQTRPGAGALVLDGPALFVPAPSLEFVNRTVVVWMGENYFYSGNPGTFGDYTNPQFRIDLAQIVGWLQSRGNRVVLLPVIPSADWATSGTGNPYAAHLAANAHTAAAYPKLYAGGLLAALQAAGNGGTNDNADIAAGFVPRSLRTDPVHLNAAGDTVVKSYVQTFMAAQTLPPLPTQNTVFSLTASGVLASTGAAVVSAPVLARTHLEPGADAAPVYFGAAQPSPAVPGLWIKDAGTTLELYLVEPD